LPPTTSNNWSRLPKFLPACRSCWTARNSRICNFVICNLQFAVSTKGQLSFNYQLQITNHQLPLALHRLSGAVSRCPRPLKVEAPELASHVDHFSNEKQARHFSR